MVVESELRKGANASQAAGAMISITPALAYVTQTAERNRAMEKSRKEQPTPVARNLAAEKR
jgi:hypothetical protein